MALDFGMLQPANIGGNIMAGRQEAQRNQLAQQQLSMGGLQQQHTQMQIEQATRERDALTKMQQAFVANGKSGDLSANFTEMMNSGIPHFVDIGVKGLQSLQNQRNFESLLKGTPSSTAPPSAAAAPPVASLSAPVTAESTATMPAADGSVIKSSRSTPVFDRSNENYNAWIADKTTNLDFTDWINQKNAATSAPATNQLAPAAAAPVASVNQLAPQSDVVNLRSKIDAAYALGTPQALAWAQSREKELAELTKPQIAPDAVLMKQLGYPLTPAGYQAFRDAQRQERMLSPEEERQKVRIAAASRPPAQPATPSAPVAVVGTDGKIKYVSREEAISKNMTPAAALEGLSPKEIQKREASYPQATTSVKAIEKNTDNLIKDLKTLRDHPGLNSITGIAAGRLPGLTSDGRAAQALYDKIIAKGGFQVLQDMREASKTGGALGNVSDKEGAQLKSAFEAIDRKQDAADVRKALDAAISTAEGSKVRVRESYDMTYEYKNQGKSTAPAAPADVVNQIPGQSSAPAASNSVRLPDGRVKTFPNAEAANQFKKDAGL
jgi:hypothetical protein